MPTVTMDANIHLLPNIIYLIARKATEGDRIIMVDSNKFKYSNIHEKKQGDCVNNGVNKGNNCCKVGEYGSENLSLFKFV